jgi:hypothetical protein
MTNLGIVQNGKLPVKKKRKRKKKGGGIIPGYL